MRKILLFITVMLCFISFSNAQTPFDIKTVSKKITKDDAKKIITQKKLGNTFSFSKTKTTFNYSSKIDDASAKDLAEKLNSEEDATPTFSSLNQYSGGLVIDDNVSNLFPTINGNLTTYRLNVYTSKNASKKVYIPISIISKVSGNSKDNNGTINDATSFFGAPLTLRLMPVIKKWDIGSTNSLVLGMIHDARMISIADTATNTVDAGFGYYGAIGFSYFGNADVIENAGNAVANGDWSFSALAYYFTSGGKFNKAVFGDYKTKSLGGLEVMLKFNAAQKENAKFNLFIAGNYGLTPNAPNYNSWQLRLGVGN